MKKKGCVHHRYQEGKNFLLCLCDHDFKKNLNTHKNLREHKLINIINQYIFNINISYTKIAIEIMAGRNYLHYNRSEHRSVFRDQIHESTASVKHPGEVHVREPLREEMAINLLGRH